MFEYLSFTGARIMDKILSAKFAIFSALLALFFFSFIDAYASRGCCSRHGGVASCDASTGFYVCKDGVRSPSCKCTTTIKQKSKTTTTTTTAPKATAPAAATTTTTTQTKATNVRGCCRGHGGVASCDKASGYQMCKDGTRSASCKCS
jgi:hypothetical protein